MMSGKQNYQYVVETIRDKSSGKTRTWAFQKLLDKYSADGWRLAAVFTNELGKDEVAVLGINFNATIDEIVLVFEKCLTEEKTRAHNEINPAAIDQKEVSSDSIDNSWSCTKCNRDNDSYAEYCVYCGEIRHRNWKCEKCGSTNSRYNNYCFKCGKAWCPSDEEAYLADHAVNLSKDATKDIQQSDIDIIKGFKSISQVIEFCKHNLPDNDNTATLINYLAQKQNVENGDSLSSSMKIIEAFYANGCKAFDVKSIAKGSMVACPHCGVTQRVDRTYCLRCLALFK